MCHDSITRGCREPTSNCLSNRPYSCVVSVISSLPPSFLYYFFSLSHRAPRDARRVTRSRHNPEATLSLSLSSRQGSPSRLVKTKIGTLIAGQIYRPDCQPLRTRQRGTRATESEIRGGATRLYIAEWIVRPRATAHIPCSPLISRRHCFA